MRTVVLESPFAGKSKDPVIWQQEVERNLRYVRAAMRDCLVNFADAPFPSHALYTQDGVLDDRIPAERTLGIDAGLLIGERLEATVVYIDLGMSSGIRYGIERAKKAGRPIEFRSLPDHILTEVGVERVALDDEFRALIQESQAAA